MKKLVSVTSALLGVLIGLEFAARACGFGSPLLYRRSASGYEVTPNQTVRRLGQVTHVNALGTRGSEAAPAPAADTYRILVLGDSVANGGTRVSDPDTWPAQLQEILRRDGRPVEVINSSAGGWAVQNAAAWLADHGPLGASMIVLEVNERDLDQPFVHGDILDRNLSFPSVKPWSAIGEVFFRYLLPYFGLNKVGVDPGSELSEFNSSVIADVIQSVDTIRVISSNNGAGLVILYWDLRVESGVAVDVAREKLFRYAKNNDIEIVRPHVNLKGDSRGLFFDDIHPNVAGNLIIATHLARKLAPVIVSK